MKCPRNPFHSKSQYRNQSLENIEACYQTHRHGSSKLLSFFLKHRFTKSCDDILRAQNSAARFMDNNIHLLYQFMEFMDMCRNVVMNVNYLTTSTNGDSLHPIADTLLMYSHDAHIPATPSWNMAVLNQRRPMQPSKTVSHLKPYTKCSGATPQWHPAGLTKDSVSTADAVNEIIFLVLCPFHTGPSTGPKQAKHIFHI